MIELAQLETQASQTYELHLDNSLTPGHGQGQ